MILAITLPLLTVLSRAGLNVLDRFQLQKNSLSILFYVLMNCLLTGVLGLIVTLCLGSVEKLLFSLISFETITWSVVLHIVSLQFTAYLRHKTIQDFLIVSKIADLVIVPLIIFLIFGLMPNSFSNLMSYQFRLFPFSLALFSLIPLCLKSYSSKSLFNQSSFLLTLVILLQCVVALFFKNANKDQQTDPFFYWYLTLGIILWRTVISLVSFFFAKKERFVESFQSFFHLVPLNKYILRSFLMLTSYGGFVLTIRYTNPLITFPIINATPLFVMLLARCALKETFYLPEMIAMVGLCLSGMI